MRLLKYVEEELYKRKWRKADLAHKLGISPQNLNTMLRKNLILSVESALKLEVLFDKPAEEIMLLSIADLIEKQRSCFTYEEPDIPLCVKDFVKEKLPDIVALKEKGYSFRKIAEELEIANYTSVFKALKRFEEQSESSEQTEKVLEHGN